MFCRWCGNKIDRNDKPCPTCGKEQEPLENGNGFWDLCDIVPENKPVIRLSVQQDEDNTNDKKEGNGNEHNRSAPGKSSGKKEKKRQPLLWVAVLILIVVFIELSAALVMINKHMENMDSIQSGILELGSALENITADNSIYRNPPVNPFVISDDFQEQGTIEGSEEISNDLEMIFNSESTTFVEGELAIEEHEIESDYAEKLLIACGYPLDLKDVRIIWQKYDEQSELWNTITEAQKYILINDKDIACRFRVLCIQEREPEGFVVRQLTWAEDPGVEE